MKPITPQPLSWIDQAPVRVSASRRIHVPAERVWERIADHESWPEWWVALKEVELWTPASGVGGRRSVSRGPVELEEEFLAWEQAQADEAGSWGRSMLGD